MRAMSARRWSDRPSCCSWAFSSASVSAEISTTVSSVSGRFASFPFPGGSLRSVGFGSGDTRSRASSEAEAESMASFHSSSLRWQALMLDLSTAIS